jgi:hypothetical protein
MTPDFRPCPTPRHGADVPGCTCDAPSMLEAAIRWAELGYAVFPVHSFANGSCSCNPGGPCQAKPPSPGKHPRTANGFKDATTDAARIRGWWSTWPDANIGWATGTASGRFVLDLDGPAGFAALAELEREHGALPTTMTVRTGREDGGEHRVFRMPQTDVRNSSARIGPKIDIRGSGGYAILPPSSHASGRRYALVGGDRPADCPAWVLALLSKPRIAPTQPQPPQVMDAFSRRGTDPTSSDAARLDGIVRAAAERIRIAPEGTRNDTLNRECFGVGGWIDGLGGTVDQVAPALEAAAVAAAQPPATVRRVLEQGRAAARGRPPETNREDATEWGSSSSAAGEMPAIPPVDPAWLIKLREAVETGDVAPLYQDPTVARGVDRPGVHALAVEELLGKLPHKDRTALKRAGKSLAQVERTSRKAEQEAPLPLVVEHRKSWWVLEGDRYLHVSRELAAVEVGRLHPRVETVISTESGSRYMTSTELFGAHGKTARKLRWTYDSEGPTWDPAERVLSVPGARVRRGAAERSELVEGWLEALVPPSQLPKLLDWLATANLLHRPTSAPQLRGPGGTGKAMLAAALATWLGGRTDYSEATSQFNGSLIEGPLVLLDEGVAESEPDAFRRLTGNREHRVCEKNRMGEDLAGCPRVLITSNESDPLRLGREELSSNSEHALGRRILVFDVLASATSYLEELGGWSVTDGWASADGELVRHLRWLAESRAVVAGKRFLVEGDGSEWVANAHTRVGTGALIVQAFLAYRDLEADSGTSTMTAPQPFTYDLDDSEVVGISVRGLQDNWGRLMGPQEKVPSNVALSKALRAMSGQEQPVRWGTKNDRGPRLYTVPKTKLVGEDE